MIPAVVVIPLSLTAALNTERENVFKCAFTGSELTNVRIDGITFNSQDILSRGIEVTTIIINTSLGLYNVDIVIPATLENNNTDIQCLSVNSSTIPVIMESLMAKFYVQG